MRYDAREFLEGLFVPDNRPRWDPTPTHLSIEQVVLWDERAAVMEDAGLPRELAEHRALLEIVGRMTPG
jgi:hypothetical protein